MFQSGMRFNEIRFDEDALAFDCRRRKRKRFQSRAKDLLMICLVTGS